VNLLRVQLRIATHRVAMMVRLLRATQRLVTAFRQFRDRFPDVTQFRREGARREKCDIRTCHWSSAEAA
jgi:hypothetical protein